MTLGALQIPADIIKVQMVGDERFGLGQAAPWLIALSALVFSVYQYFSNTRVKRLEYLEGIARSLRDEPLLGAATMMLDWEVRTIEIDGKPFAYSVLLLPHALLVHDLDIGKKKHEESTGVGFDETEALIRDAFDTLFGFFENIQYSVRLGILKQKDVREAPLYYYVGKLVEKDIWTEGTISQYLLQYGFPKTKKLIDEYKRRNGTPAELSGERRRLFEEAFADESRKLREQKIAQKQRGPITPLLS